MLENKSTKQERSNYFDGIHAHSVITVHRQCNNELYTDVVLFFFSFFSKTSASENECGARERKIKNLLLPHP